MVSCLRMDTLVTDTLLVTMDPEIPGATGDLGIVDDGAVGWTDGEITYVGPAADVEPADADHTVNGDGCLTLPGLVNAHVHGRQSILRGAAQDVPEIEWMTRALGPISGHMTGEDGIVGAKLTAIEALLSGTTTLGEYASEVAELVDQAYRPLGIRVVATERINAVPDDRSDIAPDEAYPFDREAGEESVARAENLFERFDDEPLVQPAYGPQALDMVPLDLLESITEQARTHGRTVHMHVAQGERERRQIAARYGDGSTTVGVLDDEGLLGEHLLAAHLRGDTRRARAPRRGRRPDGWVPLVDHGDRRRRPADCRVSRTRRGCRSRYRSGSGSGGHNALREARTAAMLAKADSGDPTLSTRPARSNWQRLAGHASSVSPTASDRSLRASAPTSYSVIWSRRASLRRFRPRSTRRFPIWCTVPAATRFATCSSTASNASPTAASSESTSTVWSTTRSSAPSVSLQMRKLTGAPLDHRSSRPLTTVGSEKPDCHRLTR